MDSFASDINRRVVPRWRQLARTRTEELGSVAPRNDAGKMSVAQLELKIAKWRIDPNVENAAEVAFAAIVAGEENAAEEIFKYLVDEPETPPPLRMLAGRALTGQDGKEEVLRSLEAQQKTAQARIAFLRQRWIHYPRNAFLRVEAARLYLTLGQTEAAISAMEIALKISPNDRYILRSAARLFVHQLDFKRAHRILRDSDRLRTDPWILAPEVALASMLKKPSQYLKQAHYQLGSKKFSPLQLSELASAVATIELENGATSKSRKLFRASMIDPTDNSLAQLFWASKLDRAVFDYRPPSSIKIANSSEANALQSAQVGNWENAAKSCEDWMYDEPFSSRPGIMGSFVSDALLGDPVRAERFAREGLHTNPGNLHLTNNLVVALSHQMRIDEAKAKFADIPKPGEGDENHPTYVATNGLIAFRENRIEEARALYRVAIREAEKQRRPRTALLALIHLVKEENGIASAVAKDLAAQAYKQVLNSNDLELMQALRVATASPLPELVDHVADLRKIHAQVRKAIDSFLGRK